ncbi:MAG: HlyD family secretion protein, partial [Pseudomonadota bacterium]
MRFILSAFKRILRTLLLLGGPVVVALVGAYLYTSSGRYVTTENAYVKADLIIVAPEISGRVTDVGVQDNQIV